MSNMQSALHSITKVLSVVSAVCAAFTAVTVFGQDAYPSKAVRLIIPFPPGGGTDIVARQVATKLSERLGKQVVVDNRGGAGSIIGTGMVAKADPDGYTLLLAGASFTANPALQKLPYDPLNAFTSIAKIGFVTNTLVVNPGLQANSVKEFIALAKQKPGQLMFASQGAGSSLHLAIEYFNMLADIRCEIVHFKGGGPAMIDVIGGHTHAFISSLTQTLPMIKSGKLRVLGTGALRRSAILPDVPTIAEGGVPGFESINWYGLLAPAGTPRPITDRLNSELKGILAGVDLTKWFSNEGMEVDYLGPIEFDTFIKKEMNNWVRVVKKANIKLD
jgi:tripartite-type tricarboxylate transporter receptor subunit TctC